MKLKMTIDEPEFSRPISIEKIPGNGLSEKLEAKGDEKRLLAERLGLVELSSLRAELTILPLLDQTIAVSGRLMADVTQTCVVSLEPLAANVTSNIDVLYGPPELADANVAATGFSEKEMEPIIDGMIDLGELVAQNLGIALDPYPRKPGMEFVESQYGDGVATSNPLAQLVNLRPKPKE